jgi:hypothetical protein
MSIRNTFGRPFTGCAGSAHGPDGFGTLKVPSAAHRSCHFRSISAASAAL